MEKDTMMHLKDHIKWPATGKEILEACANMSDVNGMDKKIIEEKVDPEMSYENADQLLGMIEK